MTNTAILSFKRALGFTLIEILVALFIFSLIAVMMMGGLRTVINIQSQTEKNAERLRRVQMALLILSRDIEQTVNRPILDENGKEEPAFVGLAREFTFTHLGLANTSFTSARAALQRTRYYWQDDALRRMTWAMLDRAPQSQAHARVLLPDVIDIQFQYFDNNGQANDHWPAGNGGGKPLPHAIRVEINLAHWGKISELYVVSATAENTTPPTQY